MSSTISAPAEAAPRPHLLSRVTANPVVTIAMLLFALQLVLLVGFSVFLYHRFTLGIDFAIYGQAFSSIGNGHLNPYCTVCGYSYVDSHFELIMWPMSVLYAIFHSTLLLLFVQDVSLVAINIVVFVWVLRMIQRHEASNTARIAILGGALVLLLLDPLLYGSAALDFHLEATAALFAVLTAFDLWSGRPKRAAVWAVLLLLCGDVGGLYLVGVGISALLAGRSTRRSGVVAVVAGVIWIGLIGAIGANKGSVTNEYAYLAGRVTLPGGFSAAGLLLIGMLSHPGRFLHPLHVRVHYIWHYLLAGGVIGIVTPWGFGVPTIVLLASGLQQTPLFIVQLFQQIAVVPFVAFGTASLVTGLVASRAAARSSSARHLSSRGEGSATALKVGGIALAIAALGGVVFFSQQNLTKSFRTTAVDGYIPAEEAATLMTVLSGTDDKTEVIASLPIAGRFAARKYIYLFDSPGTPIPLHPGRVRMVLDTAHTLQLASPDQDSAAIDYALQHLSAREIVSTPYVKVVEWTNPPSTTEARFP